MTQQPFLRAQPGFRDVPNPVADRLWERGLYLPSTHTLDDSKIDYIVEQIAKLGTSSARKTGSGS